MKAFVAALAVSFALAVPVFAEPAPDAPDDAAAPATPAVAGKPIDYFYGIYQGDTTVVEGSGAGTAAATRGSRVETKSAGGSDFTITWSTLYTDDENPSRFKIKDSTEITFTPAATAGAYQQKTPGTLWAGKPYYWARIDGNTLDVSALVLRADGTYDVAHYARTLESETMRLEFTRFKDGQMARHVTGTLRKSAE